MTKNKKEKKAKKKIERKQVLLDLVLQSDKPIFVLMMDLSRVGLDKQLEEEIAMRKRGITISRTITESEFKKIVGE